MLSRSYFAIWRHTLRYKARAAGTSRPFHVRALRRGRLGVGCWIQQETLVGCMATNVAKGETDLLVTRHTLDTSCFSGPLSASSWAATTKLGQALRSMSRLSSARRLSSRAAGRLLALAHNSRWGGVWGPGGVCTRGGAPTTVQYYSARDLRPPE